MRTRIHLAMVLAALLVACGGGEPTIAPVDGPTSSGTPVATVDSDTAVPSPPATPVAGLGIIDAAVDLADAGTPTEFVAAEDGADLAEGDVVRTDVTGFAQLDFADGAVARVDVDTTMAVTSIGDAEQLDVELQLDVGRVWNNVRDLDADERYQITTDVGVAAVRGTVFLVWCFQDGACLVAVFEGVVEVTGTDGVSVELGAGQATVLNADGTTGVATPLPDGLDEDPWVVRNRDLDGGGDGAAAPVESPTSVLDGDYDVVWTATADARYETQSGLTVEEATGGIYADLPQAGGATTTDLWTIANDTWVPRATVSFTVIPAGEPGGFTGGSPEQSVTSCDIPDNGTFAQFLEIEVTATEEVDGRERATALTGTFTVVEDFGDGENCMTHRYFADWTFTATRIGPPSIDP